MMEDELRESRRKRACASILENESLTEGLDDSCAGILLDWILPDVERIADTAETVETFEADLKKVRKFMRLVSGQVSGWPGGHDEGGCDSGGVGIGHDEGSGDGDLEAALYAPEDLSGGLVHDAAGLCAALRAAMRDRESVR